MTMKISARPQILIDILFVVCLSVSALQLTVQQQSSPNSIRWYM